MFAKYILQTYENGTKKANILQLVRKGLQSPFANYLQNVCFFRSIFIRLKNISCKANCNQFANRENIFRKGTFFVCHKAKGSKITIIILLKGIKLRKFASYFKTQATLKLTVITYCYVIPCPKLAVLYLI